MTSLIDLDIAGRAPLRIEFAFIAPERSAAPLVVFLHEGLGSVAMWRDFPAQLCDVLGVRGLVYSRPGYGRSTPRAHDERWPVDYLERHARDVLPPLLAALGVDTAIDPPWFFGHSDGGSIALIFAASFPDRVCGIAVAAPHIFVEAVTLAGIAATRESYLKTPLRERLGRFHDDVDSAFHGWNDAWLDPAFRAWNIEALLPAIRCPVLAIQGEEDEYATMAQIDGIAAGAPPTQLLKLAHCGHSPHRDQADAVIAAVAAWMQRHGARVTLPASAEAPNRT